MAPYGKEREDLLLKESRLETASNVNEWVMGIVARTVVAEVGPPSQLAASCLREEGQHIPARRSAG